MDSTEAYLALNLLPKIGPIRVRRMLELFQTPERILSANRRELREVPGIGEEMADQIVDWENHIDLEEEKRRIESHGIHLVTLEDEEYPSSLREIHDPPFLLYVKGKLLPKDSHAIGVVGSRRTTHYGKEQAKKLSFQLARAGLTIISGLARGIDTAAHEAAVAAGGRTVAVLGSGIGNLYPPENQALADQIAKESGAVISEFPVLYVPDKQSFPLRNRIVSGMSRGLLVVEAPARSGSLITANQALEQGRTVFAVPGPIDRPTSEGCNRLIQQGAILVCGARDILDEINTGFSQLSLAFPTSDLDTGESADTSSLSDSERAILKNLEAGEQTIDQLCEAAGLPAHTVSVALLQLEMRGQIRQLPGKYFTKLI